MKGLNWHDDLTPAEEFEELAAYCRKHNIESDIYGEGKFLNDFEEEIAKFLGLDAAVFMPSGTMAQQIALRIWAERLKIKTVALHETSHVEANEKRGYSYLHGLQTITLGGMNSAILAKHLDEIKEPVSTLLIELPMRALGGLLPTWDELLELLNLARSRKIKVHLDGARIWEASTFYDKSCADICQLFDSVYVSFYKGIGGMTGSMLLGPNDFIEESRIWLRRHGGNLHTMTPYVVSAKLNFEKRINKMHKYRNRAISLAKALKDIPGLETKPDPPQVNMFHVFINASLDQLQKAHETLMKEDNFRLCTRFAETQIPNWTRTEIAVGDQALSLSNEEIVEKYRKLIALAGNQLKVPV
ncbi:MAG: aminotransferase class I/II-fold pyridoxal phosphate-dependent enzyme [Candidatus Obscuribacterales bacterium]|nr:aminotransferase class I/II-fold pyridoxal phosphate-dependent enzyme [Candidatus Obscuribacterales bacterium]